MTMEKKIEVRKQSRGCDKNESVIRLDAAKYGPGVQSGGWNLHQQNLTTPKLGPGSLAV